ncbi:MAG: Orotidine 5'-phosphate decarboxylase [uncultured Solirubrobacteraceae bacterium]|uniref:Orotidine 5'-phosphate decarboxylase n=1 Tax=uncultured Solirubrobacteraceae bacterium TaxID=1162706 RepID=A0A6J4RQY7_9ACTN|nr:MAG: Orotidine 5'-phosphate decarboxylase [uncultured Solirubrobacteraceae bacterium]
MESGAGDSSPGPDTASSAMPPTPFGERLATAVADRESQIVLGLDPDPSRLWPSYGDESPSAVPRERLTASGHGRVPADPDVLAVADAVLAHCRALIDAAGPACVAVKPQLACFERLGGAGGFALEAACAHARRAGLLVLADGKRGDVPVTAAAYAQALLSGLPVDGGRLPGLQADATTINPLLGRDSLVPLVDAARAGGQGVFALVRTSNPGAADVMDARLADGRAVWELLAELVDDLGRDGRSAASGLSDVGAVTGATVPAHLERMREVMPHTIFLLPGVGAQGGDVEALAAAFAPGRAAGLVTASRSIAGAHESTGEAPAAAARREAERLRRTAWELT